MKESFYIISFYFFYDITRMIVSLYFIVHYAAKAGPGYSDRLGTKIAGNIENERGPSPGPQDTG